MFIRTPLLCSTLLLALCASNVSAAKPAPPPTPTCNNPGSMEPSIAFAYSYKLYVGNVDGTCAIQLATLATQLNMAFAAVPTPPGFIGTKYRVFWYADTRDEVKRLSQLRWTVKMVEFTVGPTGGINEPLPLPVRELYRDAVTTSYATVSSVSADEAGEHVIFTRTQGTTTEIKRIDVSACNPGCPAPETIIALNNSSTVLEFGRAGDNRIYVKENLTGGEQVLAFYEYVVGSGWLGPRVVARTTDAFYAARGAVHFGGVSVTRQDWEDDAVDDDLVALPWALGGAYTPLRVDVLKIGPGCTVTGVGSCLSDLTASVVSDPAGLDAYVNWYGIDWRSDGALLRVNDTSGTTRIESFDPHFGDTLVDHGPGVYPTGLKQ